MYITQDTRGFLWFGTHDGLNRYDGHHFKIYKHDPAAPGSLSTNYITALLAARGGGLWIGTLSGLDWYDPIQDTFRHVMKRDQSFPNSVRYIFNCIFQDKQGNTWVGTSRGLAFIPVGQKRVTRRIFPGGPV